MLVLNGSKLCLSVWFAGTRLVQQRELPRACCWQSGTLMEPSWARWRMVMCWCNRVGGSLVDLVPLAIRQPRLIVHRQWRHFYGS
jgi:hypothetical protein